MASQAAASGEDARSYTHPEADAALRPDVGIQKQFKGKKSPKQYRYDSSLSPSLEWDEQPARVQGEALIADVLKAKTLEEAKAAAEQLKAISKPFLNWAGKAERQAFEVPTLPLFVHERLSTDVANGQDHEYYPDYLIRLSGNDQPTTLILEVKGRSDPDEGIKTEAAQRWVAAVNAEGSFGRWGYAMVRDPRETFAIVSQLAR